MSELPRRMAAHLRRFVLNRRRARRARALLQFTLSIEDPRLPRNGFRRVPPIKGHTLDVSATGLALIVPAIRIGEHYLAGTDRRLFLRLELPDGAVEITAIPVRYESLEEDPDENGYVIGAHIENVNEKDRVRFSNYVAALLKNQRSYSGE
jgi:hypothetical protein